MKVPALVLSLLAVASPLAAQAAVRVAASMPAAELAALESLRKDIWVQWFTGDTSGLHKVLAPELVAVSPDSPEYQTLQNSLDGSARYKASGAKFISVDFAQNKAHRFGDVVVLFTHYTVVTEKAGKRSTQKGRATEIFVRQDGKWVHTSWHIDIA